MSRVPQLEGTEVEAGPDLPVLRPMAFPTVWAPRDIRNRARGVISTIYRLQKMVSELWYLQVKLFERN